MFLKKEFMYKLFTNFTIAVFISLLYSCVDTNKSINQSPKNNSPEIVAITFSQDTIASGSEVKVVVTVIDLDGDSLSYNWNSEIGYIQGNSDTVFWSLPADTVGVFYIKCEVIDEVGATDTDSALLNLIPQLYSVHGIITGYSPSGIHPIEGTDVNLPLALNNQSTNINGEFIAQFMQIPDTISFNANHTQYQNKDTTISFSDLEPIEQYVYKGLNLRLNKLVNYIPIAVGNEWHYNSKKSYFDATIFEGYELKGSEIWRILGISSDSSSFSLEISFSGYRINNSDTTWSGSDTTTLNVIKDDSLWTASTNNYLIPGVTIISFYSLPYYFPYQNNVFSATFNFKPNPDTKHQIDLSAEYGIGILSYRSEVFQNTQGISSIYKLTLTNYVIH